jgi:hypothetical protein
MNPSCAYFVFALHKPLLVGMIEEARDKGVSHQLTSSLGLTQLLLELLEAV